MMNQLFLCLVISVLFVVAAGREFILSDLETPPYEVVRKEKSYELRKYESAKWACHDLEKENYISRFMETQYYQLHQYISGENKEKKTIPITAPVIMKVISEPGGNTKIQMCFYIPKAFQQNVPKPTNKKVYIEEMPTRTVLSREFGGYVSRQAEFEEEADKLRNDLMVQNENTEFSYFYSVTYDPPVGPNERKNEIWFVQQ